MCYKNDQMQIMRKEVKWHNERSKGQVVEAEKRLWRDGTAFGVERGGNPDTKKKVPKYRLPWCLQRLIVFIIQLIALRISLHFVFFLPLLSIMGCCLLGCGAAPYLAFTSGTLEVVCTTLRGEVGDSADLSFAIISSTSIIKAFPKIKSWMSRHFTSVGLW